MNGKKWNSKIYFLSDFTHFIQGLESWWPLFSVSQMPKLQLWRVIRKKIKSVDKNPFHRLAQQDGLCFVLLEANGMVDYAIFVDDKNLLIWNSMENYLVPFSLGIIRTCGGSGEKELRLTEVREVV